MILLRILEKVQNESIDIESYVNLLIEYFQDYKNNLT